MKKAIAAILILLSLNISLFSVDKIDELSFTDTDITQVLKTVSEIFGITIVPDREVTGQVTRYFKDTNLEQTLVLLLEPLGFVYEIKEGIYFVNKKPSFKEIKDQIVEHLDLVIDYYGERGIVPMRKHLVKYIHDFKGASELRKKLIMVKTRDSVIESLDQYY